MTKLLVDTEELYPPEQAAKLIGIGIATLWRWVKKDKLVPLRLSGRIFIPKSEIERLKKERTNKQNPSKIQAHY